VRTRRESGGGRAGAGTGAHVGPALEQRGQTARERFRGPATRVHDAEEQLAGELGVVAVLAEGKIRVSQITGPPGEKVLVDVPAGGLEGARFDHEPQGVAQGLPENAAGQGRGSRSHHARRVMVVTVPVTTLESIANAKIHAGLREDERIGGTVEE
jgi:hypothetical protein